MSNTNVPGVFIKEVSTLPRSVAQVATAVPAFIGTHPSGPAGPTRIASFKEFISIYGTPYPEILVVVTNGEVTDIKDNTVPASPVAFPSLDTSLYFTLQAFYANGGGVCYVINDTLTNAIDELEKLDEPTLIVSAASIDDETEMNAILAHCSAMQDRFAILDTEAVTSSEVDDFQNLTLTNVSYGAVYSPPLISAFSFAIKDDYTNVSVKIDAASAVGLETIKASNSNIFNKAIAGINNFNITIPASGAVAGIYASVDASRGVWKAPANVGVAGIKSPSVQISDVEQNEMNVDATSGKSINAIRKFTGKGTLVWGARTLDGNSNEWRYVPVRRLFITVEESIKKATEFVVFEPNDANTWMKTKAMIENYLTNLWRQGALAGAKAEEAFFVNVGLGSTMTSADILEGKMIIQVGIAAVRPAEFIVLQFTHKVQE